jgi:hypothetical protein
MGCCDSRPEKDEQRGLLGSDPVPPPPVSSGPSNAPTPLDKLEHAIPVPIHEEHLLADVAMKTQKNFIVVPPSSFQEPNRLDQEFLQDREEFYRSHLSQVNKHEEKQQQNLPNTHIDESDLEKLLDKPEREYRNEAEFLVRAARETGSAGSQMNIMDVGPLVTNFDESMM